VIFDSLSELRLLAGDPLRYRRQLLALKQFFRGRHCTVLLLDDLTGTARDLQVQSIAHGVISLEQLTPEYGADRRRLRVLKHRGRRFRGGFHDYLIGRGGLEVFPRLVAAEHRTDHPHRAPRQQRRDPRQAAGRRPRARHEHAHRRRRRHGQVLARRAIRGQRGEEGPARGDVPLRREHANAALAHRRTGNRAAPLHR
jgi:hypothetical protein